MGHIFSGVFPIRLTFLRGNPIEQKSTCFMPSAKRAPGWNRMEKISPVILHRRTWVFSPWRLCKFAQDRNTAVYQESLQLWDQMIFSVLPVVLATRWTPRVIRRRKRQWLVLDQGPPPAASPQLSSRARPLLRKVKTTLFWWECFPRAGIFISVWILNHYISSDAFLCLQLTSS